MKATEFATDAPARIRARVDSETLNRRQRAEMQRQAIHAYLRGGILTAIFVCGDNLPAERQLASDFGANRRTVRDVLEQLRREGLIESRIGSGSVVVWNADLAPTSQDLPIPACSPIDAIEARRVIEPNFVDLVVARATGDDFARMREKLSAMRAAADQVTFKKSGYDFHLEVVRATRNPLLVAMYEMLIAARARAGWNTLVGLNDREEQREQQITGNTELYKALSTRDAARARELAHVHLTDMLHVVVSLPIGT